MGSFRFAKYDNAGVGIDDPNATATYAKVGSAVPGDGIPLASADLATTTGEAGQMYRLTDGPDAGAPLTWATPSGATSPTWCWWAWPQSAYEG